MTSYNDVAMLETIGWFVGISSLTIGFCWSVSIFGSIAIRTFGVGKPIYYDGYRITETLVCPGCGSSHINPPHITVFCDKRCANEWRLARH